MNLRPIDYEDGVGFGEGWTRAGSEVEHEECDRGYKPKDDNTGEQRTAVWHSTHGYSEKRGRIRLHHDSYTFNAASEMTGP